MALHSKNKIVASMLKPMPLEVNTFGTEYPTTLHLILVAYFFGGL